MDTHPLGIVFDKYGICSGCRIHEEKDSLDWAVRWKKLEDLVEPYRRKDAGYDCIVPVSGGSDSFFILDVVVNRLKLKPLAVAYNRYFNTPEGIENLANLRMQFNVDFQLKNVNPLVVKKVTRTSLFKYGNMYWPVLAGQSVFPVQSAVMMRVPLIIWGAHQGLEQVGMFSHTHEVEMTRRYRKDHDLFGLEAHEVNGPFDGLVDDDLLNYRYPSFSDIQAVGVRGIYLGNFIRWDPVAQHQQMVKNYGFRSKLQGRTFDIYDHADCYAYTGVHDLLKFFKHGYGKVRDQTSREIRHGRMTREEGAKLVSWYEYQEPLDMDLFSEWLGVPLDSIRYVLNRYRNLKFWEEIKPNVWTRRQNSGDVGRIIGVDQVSIEKPILPYQQTGLALNQNSCEPKYINVGRGVSVPRAPEKQIGSVNFV